ncbi:MAG: M13 family metallopeptidase, partial [Myxococcales bacterium]|nr:M13 family metallopeptidase [Myxococcales bacterium]
ASPAPAPAAPAAPAAPKPEIGTWGFDEAGMDKSVAPGASFFQYANGGWLKSTQIPADKSNYGMFTALADRSEERTKQLLETAKGPAGSDAQRIGDYYKSFMDETAIEALGLAPLKPRLDDVEKITNPAGLVLQFAAASRRMGESPFRIDVQQDARDPERYLADLSQGGLGLPDRDMYDAKAKQFDGVRAGYKQYIGELFTLLGWKDAEKRAAAVYALEEKIAKAHWTRLQNRDPQKTYNKVTTAQLQKQAPGIDWKPWLAGVGLDGQPAINLSQPSAITAIAALVKSQPIAVWKDYLTLQIVGDASDFLPKRFVDLDFEMFGKRLTGTPQNQERWKRAVAFTTGQLGEAVGALYVAKYFTPETKASADQLVKNLLVTMGQRLDVLTWMGEETKAKAKEKLATYNPKIGFPKKWRDYSAYKIVAGDAVGNATRGAQFEYDRRLAKIGKPVDRDEWGMTPMTVNAYYNPVLNEIVFPAAILQPPFFDVNADAAVNYGGIGAVIGHEISHGFDDQGSQFDAKGALKNWWTKADNDKFKVATGKLIAQYDAYCPVPAADGKPAQCVKGALTLGENIADLAGLTIAYNAYKLSLGGKPAPVINGVTGDQRFFLGWAQVWRRIYRDQEYANRLVTDVHSPAEFRVSVVRNLDTWYEAFQPKETDALYLSPDKRVKIW